jgi:hypothetical protein
MLRRARVAANVMLPRGEESDRFLTAKKTKLVGRSEILMFVMLLHLTGVSCEGMQI